MEKIVNFINDCSTPQKILYSAGTLASVYIAKSVYNQIKLKAAYKKHRSQAIAARKKRDEYIKNTIIPEHGISQNLQNKILNCSLKELKQMLDDKLFTSEQLLNFYARRMHTIGFEHKLITESNYEAALQRARQCDSIRKNHPDQVKGELFGIVMTIKDTFDLKGLASTIGCAAKINDIPKDDGLTVKIFQNAGAIFYAKTNIPQVAMATESINYVWDTAQNPWNKKRSCGGSSGGSGGSVAAKVTPLCFGSDIGGSIRFPSAFNGVTGLKPGSRRMTTKGHTFYSPAFDGQISIPNTIGPIGRSVDDCALAMETFLNKENYNGIKKSEQDLYYNIKPWDYQQYNSTKKLRIGYYKSLDLFPSAKAVQRGVMIAVEALKNRGHELIEIQMPNVPQMIDDFFKIIVSDGGISMLDILKGEEPLSHYKDLLQIYQSSNFFRSFLSILLSILGQKRLSHTVQGAHSIDSYEYRNITYRIQQYRTQYIEIMDNQNLDAIVCPTFGTVSGEHNFTKELLLPFIYSAIYNVLDFPSGVVPVTLVEEDEQIYEDGINDLMTKEAKKVMKGSKGMPVGIQVASLPYQEETAMNVMKQIEQEVQFNKKHPLNIQ